MTKVFVETDGDRNPIRIFKNNRAAIASGVPDLLLSIRERKEAVGYIRHQIYLRQAGQCATCPNTFTEAGMHMHEKHHRGRGGEISLANSEGLCYSCHLRPGTSIVHPEKQLNFTKRGEKL